MTPRILFTKVKNESSRKFLLNTGSCSRRNISSSVSELQNNSFRLSKKNEMTDAPAQGGTNIVPRHEAREVRVKHFSKKTRECANLGEVVYITVIHHIPDSWLNSLNGYGFYFR